MSFPRLSQIAVLALLLSLPLLAGGCTESTVAVAAASYGTDAASVAQTGKTTSDHFASVVTEKDCALWRMFKNQDICRDRDMTHDIYHVNYDEPFRQQGEAGTEYGPAPHSAADAPATSWDAAAYKPAAPAPAPASAIVVADNPAPAATTAEPAAAPAPAVVKHKTKPKKPKPAATDPKKPPQDQVASSP